MRRSAPLILATLATLSPMGACGDGNSDQVQEREPRRLVTYTREGGIRFQASALAISRGGKATFRSDGCSARFRLGVASWRRLRQALRQVDLSKLAGDYPARAGAADVIAQTIVVGRHKVRIGDPSALPPGARKELEPLLGALSGVFAEGAHRARSRCASG